MPGPRGGAGEAMASAGTENGEAGIPSAAELAVAVALARRAEARALVCHMALVADIVQQINIKLTYRTCKMMIFGSRYVTYK